MSQPEEVPWTTADELAPDICERLGYPDAVVADAVEIATAARGRVGGKPSTVAAASVLLAAHGRVNVTLRAVADAAGKETGRVRTATRELHREVDTATVQARGRLVECLDPPGGEQ